MRPSSRPSSRLFSFARRLCAPRLIWAVIAATALVQSAQAQPAPLDLDARVAHAQQFVSGGMAAKVRNAGLTFNWIGDSDRFWFRKSVEGGSEFTLVDAGTGVQQPLFDSEAMANALVAGGMRPGAPIRNIMVPPEGRSVVVMTPEAGAACRWPTSGPACDVPMQSYLCDLPVTSCRATPARPGADVVMSPDRRRAVFAREHNLWVRDLTSGEERPLTTAGVEHFAYGRPHHHVDYQRVIRARAGLPDPLLGVLWSPDGRYILSIRHDLRQTPERLVATEYLPADGGRPRVYTDRIAIAADPEYPDASVETIDVETGEIRSVDVNPKLFGDYTSFVYALGAVSWSPDGRRVSFVAANRGGTEMHLLRIDMATGRAEDLIREHASAIARNINITPAVHVTASGDEAIWYSDRDGWSHLYLYDLTTGLVKSQITRGDWLVTDLLHVDDDTRTVYFTAAGREAGRNVYYRHLYSVSMDGGEPTLLTPEDADHEFAGQGVRATPGGNISPNGRYVIDSYSTLAQPDRVVVRTLDGRITAHVIEADSSALEAEGWRPPEQFVVKAADGETDLYGVLIKPRDFDPAKKYPVIEITYPGPGSRFTPITFRENFLLSTTLNAYAFAETGAIVVTVEGRGGGMRSRAFRTAFEGEDDRFAAIDHVTAIQNVAATRPYMDLDRVGVTGHSHGGYATLRAMLLYPDFFKVGVSGESPGDKMVASLEFGTERVFGIPNTPEGRDYYSRTSAASLAERLDGDLMVIFAGLDENVPFQSAFHIISALNDANKVYDTLIMPDATHTGGREPYGVMRTIRYFAEHLGGPQ